MMWSRTHIVLIFESWKSDSTWENVNNHLLGVDIWKKRYCSPHLLYHIIPPNMRHTTHKVPRLCMPPIPNIGIQVWNHVDARCRMYPVSTRMGPNVETTNLEYSNWLNRSVAKILYYITTLPPSANWPIGHDLIMTLKKKKKYFY